MFTQHRAWDCPKLGLLEKQVPNASNLKQPQSQGAERAKLWELSPELGQLWVGLQGREGLSNLPQLTRRHSPSPGTPRDPIQPLLLMLLPSPGCWRPCHCWSSGVSRAGKVSPRALWSLQSERGVGGHFLVLVFNHQVHAAALGAMPNLSWSSSRCTDLDTDISVLYFCGFP